MPRSTSLRDERVQKLRGGRRYFRRIRREADAVLRRLHEERPGGLWHHHFDFRGFSERSHRLRIAHRRILIETFTRAQVVLESSGRPGQVFVQFAAPGHSRHDALYCSTWAEGQVAHVYRYPLVEWAVPPPRHVLEVVADRHVRVGRVIHESHEYWVAVDSRDPALPV